MNNSKRTKLRIGKKAIVISTLFLALIFALSAFSYAWFRHKIAMDGVDVSTGKIAYRFVGYQTYEDDTVKKNFAYSTDSADYNNTFNFETQEGYYPIGVDDAGNTEISQSPVSGVSSIISDSDKPNVTTEKNGVFYYMIERLEDSVDLDVSLIFNPQIENLRVAGGFWYNVETRSLNTASDNIASVFGDSTLSDRSPLSNIQNTAHTTTLENGSKYWYIKLTFGLQERAESVDYTNQNIALAPTLCVAQKGGLEDYDQQAERVVTTLEAFERELANYTPNETIVVKGPIEYLGDLIINRPLNLRIEGATLTVRGDLRYNYTGAGNFTVDTSVNGTLRVLTHEGSGTGGNVYIETPASSFTFIGKRSNDVEVQGNFTVSVAYHVDGVDGDGEEMSYGLVIDKARISHTDGNLKTLRFRDMSSLHVTKYTEIGEVRVYSNAHLYRMKINNEGTVKKIDLAAMSAQNAANSFSGLSISIENQNTVTEPIVLPQWSTPVTETITDGNTKISRHLSASETTIVESEACAFKNEHIVIITKEVLIEKDANDPKKITLHYMKTKEQQESGEPTSIQTILNAYTNAEDETQILPLDQITHLTVVCNGEQMTEADYEYIRENMTGLTYLDLTDVLSENAAVPTGAFEGLSNLKTVIMPYSDTAWGDFLFSKTLVDEVTVPLTVKTVTAATFTKNNANGTGYVRYIYVESDEALTLGNNSLIFVPNEETVDKYSGNKGNVFVKADRFDTEYGTFFLKLTATGCEFVVWDDLKTNWMDAFTSNTLRTVNVNATEMSYYEIDMSSVKASSNVSYDIESIGRYAFYNTSATNGTRLNGTQYRYVLKFGEKLKTVEKEAFNNCNDIYAIYADSVTHLGTSAIANCSSLYRVVFPSLVSIGEANSTDAIVYNCAKLNWVETGVLNRNHTTTKCAYFANNCPSVSLFLIDPPTDGSSYTSIDVPKPLVYGNSNTIYVISGEYYSYYSGNKVSMLEATRDELTFSPAPAANDVFTVPKFVIHEGTLLVSTYTTCEADNVFDGLPNDVHTIGARAFQYMKITSATNPKSVLKMPDNVTQIESYAFFGSNKVYNTIDLNNVINVKNRAFSQNYMISVSGPKVERLGVHAFSESKMYRLDLPEWRYVYANPGSGQEGHENYPCYFYNCTNLRYANLGPLDNIGTNTWAFWKCTKLALVTIDGARRGSGSTKVSELGWYSDTSKFLAIVSGGNSVIAESGNAEAYEILVDSLNDLAYIDFETTDIELSGLTDQISLPSVILTKNGEGTYTFRKYNQTTISGEYVIPSTLHETEETAEFLGETVDVYAFDTGDTSTQIGVINELTSGAFSSVTFKDCKKITMSSQVKTIGSSTFANCAAEEFDLANVEVLGSYAFSGAKMKKITAEHVKTISERTFENCTNLTELELPAFENSTCYNSGSFIGSALTKITFGPNTKNLGKYLFYKCNSLNTIIIQSAVVPTANDPFYIQGKNPDPANITMIVREQAGFLADGATNWQGVPKDNFEYYDNSVEIDKILYYWDIIDGTHEAKITGAELADDWTGENVSTLVIPSTLTFLPSDALPIVERLIEDLAVALDNENVTYGGYLTALGITEETSAEQDILDAFLADNAAGWEKLKAYLVSVLTAASDPETEEGAEAAETAAMTEEEANAAIETAMTAMAGELDNAVDIANKVGDYKVVYFNGDVIKNVSLLFKFKELTLPYGLRTLDFGYDAIPSTLERFSITKAPDGETVYFTVDERGALYNGDRTMLLFYPVGNAESSYTVSDTVKIISSNAFRNNGFLTSVTFEGDVTVASNAFDGCFNLVEVIFKGNGGDGETSLFIGYEIFYNCGNLERIVVPVGELDAYKAKIVYDRIIIESYLTEAEQTA